MDAVASKGDKRRNRRRHGAPTIGDVARHAGVSAMTVSRVVNGDAGVREETRERVQAAISELAFTPNVAARQLAGVRPLRIAMLYANPSAAYLGEFLLGSLAGVRTRDAELLVEQCAPGESVADMVQHLLQHRADAVLLAPPLCDDPLLLVALQDAGIAIAQVATGVPAEFAQAVVIDDRAAALAMTRHLLSLGHQRIGFISGASDQHSSRLRQDGHLRALSEAGIAPDPDLLVQGDYTFHSGLEGARRLLGLPQPPTAIFASNDDMAAGVISVAQRQGLVIPQQLSVCGFDDTPLATTLWPELTTVRQPVANMAERAIMLLVDAAQQAANGDAVAVEHVTLDFELIVRQSAACKPEG